MCESCWPCKLAASRSKSPTEYCNKAMYKSSGSDNIELYNTALSIAKISCSTVQSDARIVWSVLFWAKWCVRLSTPSEKPQQSWAMPKGRYNPANRRLSGRLQDSTLLYIYRTNANCQHYNFGGLRMPLALVRGAWTLILQPSLRGILVACISESTKAA